MRRDGGASVVRAMDGSWRAHTHGGTGDFEDDVRERVARVRARQAQWMRERDSERLRESIEAEMRDEEVNPCPSDLEQSHRADERKEQLDPARVMNQITERLVERARDELREELRAEVRRDETARVAAERQRGAEADASLSRELEQTHTCPICYDVMHGTGRTPQLLFPCGHTFCERCLKRHIDRERKSTCPFCRATIESRATNVSLQQLIQSYVSKQRRMQKVPSATPDSATTSSSGSGGARHIVVAAPAGDMGDDTELYASRAEQLAVRIRILSNEWEDNRAQIHELDKRRTGIERVVSHLSEEATRLTTTMASLRAELKVVDEHLGEQKKKEQAVRVEADELEMRAKIVSSTLDALRAEYDKTLLLRDGSRQHV